MESRIFDGVSARNRDEHRGNAMILLFHGVENRLALHPVPANRLEETGSRVIKSISRPVCYTASFCSLESIHALLLFYFLHCRFSLTKNKTLEWKKRIYTLTHEDAYLNIMENFRIYVACVIYDVSKFY